MARGRAAVSAVGRRCHHEIQTVAVATESGKRETMSDKKSPFRNYEAPIPEQPENAICPGCGMAYAIWVKGRMQIWMDCKNCGRTFQFDYFPDSAQSATKLMPLRPAL